jgi:hypothetical protein
MPKYQRRKAIRQMRGTGISIPARVKIHKNPDQIWDIMTQEGWEVERREYGPASSCPTHPGNYPDIVWKKGERRVRTNFSCCGMSGFPEAC